MVIGFDASRAFVKEKTGTENYSYQLLKALSNIDRVNKYKVYIRPFISYTIIELMKLFPKNFEFVQIKWNRIWTQGGLAVQTFKDNLDVLFVPSHTLPVVRRMGLKTVMTVHDLGAEYLPAHHQIKQRLYLKYIAKYQLSSVTKLIAVSHATKKDLVRKAGIDEKKIEVIYEGYDKNLFNPTKTDINGYSLNKYYIFVGTVQPRKNLIRLIKAFSVHLRSVGKSAAHTHFGGVPNLVIVGSKGWMSEGIYNLPKRLGVEKRVKFLGFVPEKDMPALYSGAEALLFPSLFEGFGLPILEAQACGCPVLTSNTSSMPEVAGIGAVYVNPTSVKDIIKGMEGLKATGYRQQLIKKGFENIKRFSWEKCAAQTLKVLENL